MTSEQKRGKDTPVDADIDQACDEANHQGLDESIVEDFDEVLDDGDILETDTHTDRSFAVAKVSTMHIGSERAGERIDKVLTDLVHDVSRTQLQEWILAQHVLVNGHGIKPNYKLREGDTIRLTIPEPEPTDIEPENIPLDIVYEDADVIVVNKPRGMVVHPAAGHHKGTLVNALLYHCGRLATVGGEHRPGIVHRIDKDTTGLLMAAKTDLAQRGLSQQLKEHSVTRKYTALVSGVLSHDVGTIDAPIGRHPVHRQQMAVVAGGKEAITHFSVIERFRNTTLVELKLETGRTHQIRVHMDYIGHPLIGDPKYGRRNTGGLDGQALHAGTLGFVHPRSGEYKEFVAALPEDFKVLLDRLRFEG